MNHVLPAFLFLAACATIRPHDMPHTQSKSFNPYVLTYIKYKLKYRNSEAASYPITIEFTEAGFPETGHCYRLHDKRLPRTVTINREYWNRTTEEDRIKLLFHELGHCDLDFDHQEHSVGIMNSHSSDFELTESIIQEFFLSGR